MGWRRVQIVVQFLHVLAMVALGVAQAEQSLLENRIPAVPKRQREAKYLVPVTDASQSILAPTVSSAPSLIMSQIVPGLTTCGVVLAYRPPLPFAEIRPPQPPGAAGALHFFQPLFFGGHNEHLVLDRPLVRASAALRTNRAHGSKVTGMKYIARGFS